VVTSWVTDDDESWFLELLGVLIGKGTRGPLSTEVVSTSVGSELEDGSLSELSVGDNENIFRVVDGSDDSSSDHQFLPSFGEVEVVDTLVSGVNVWLHLSGAVEGTNMGVRGKHEGQIFGSGVRVGKGGHI